MIITKNLEAKCRRQLDKFDYRLVKNRSRTPESINYRRYMIIDRSRNFVIAGGDFQLNLDDVVKFINKQKA